MLEPDHNPNPRMMVDPPVWLRRLMRWKFDSVTDAGKINKRRSKAEMKRQRCGAPHIVEYFHQLDDPYSHLTAQVLAVFAERYDVVVKPHLIRASGGKNQPELEKLARWARRDAALVAPHLGLQFPVDAPLMPAKQLQEITARNLGCVSDDRFVSIIAEMSSALWNGEAKAFSGNADIDTLLEQGSSRQAELGHYSGATFYYAGEWYWGVDRLFHLEQRLRDLSACKNADLPFICPRPEIDVNGVDASALTLDFYPSLNSPYTSIIYDRTIALKNECGIQFTNKPVLPMIMRGVPATHTKGIYIMFDTWREGRHLGVDFGPVMTPIGEPTRQAYSLLPWAKKHGKDEALMSALLHHAFRNGATLHSRKGMKQALKIAGLDWAEASKHLGSDDWKAMVERHQDEMVEDLGLWGVPSFRLSGPEGEPDLAVWGQDRLWLVAAEIRRRAPKRGLPEA